MSKFMRGDKIYTNVDDLSTAKGIKELLDVDVSCKRCQLSSKIVDVGTKAKLLFIVRKGVPAPLPFMRHPPLAPACPPPPPF